MNGLDLSCWSSRRQKSLGQHLPFVAQLAYISKFILSQNVKPMADDNNKKKEDKVELKEVRSIDPHLIVDLELDEGFGGKYVDVEIVVTDTQGQSYTGSKISDNAVNGTTYTATVEFGEDENRWRQEYQDKDQVPYAVGIRLLDSKTNLPTPASHPFVDIGEGSVLARWSASDPTNPSGQHQPTQSMWTRFRTFLASLFSSHNMRHRGE